MRHLTIMFLVALAVTLIAVAALPDTFAILLCLPLWALIILLDLRRPI